VDSFSYLSVLLSIILGLAITQVLQGLRGLILTRAKVKLYIPTLIWAGLTLLIAIQGWWASFGMRTHANWTFVALLVIVLRKRCRFGALGESSHGFLSLARTAAMAGQDNRYKFLALFPSLSFLSTELSDAKAHSRQSRFAVGKSKNCKTADPLACPVARILWL
jgi:hypothetical protein